MVEAIVEHFASLVRSLEDAQSRWAAALGGMRPSGAVDDDVDAMSDADLLALNEALAAVERRCQALHAHIAHGIGKRSARDLGKGGLARQAGFKSPEKLISTVTGGHPADAQRLIQVGEATASRITFTGERAPARHPHVAGALAAATVSVPVAYAITAMLDKLAVKVSRVALDEAEKTFVEQAAGLSLKEMQAVLRRAEAYLDPDGAAPKIESLRGQAYLKMWENQAGMICVDAQLDPERGAPVRAAITAIVTAQIRATRGRNEPGDSVGTGSVGGYAWDATSVADADDQTDGGTPASNGGGLGEQVEKRTIVQLQADALVTVCKHLLGCEQTTPALVNTTVIVRIPLEALTTGIGVATIDGITQPIDAGTARRMAADAEIIPLVLGERSEVLDLGRARRLFTTTQRLALVERDGGCVGCGAPPEHCEAHHLTWWSRGGCTDLSNGVLLCTSCHHTIHAEEWQIRVDGAEVWLIPPVHIDPARTPRSGGRRRYDYHPAA